MSSFSEKFKQSNQVVPTPRLPYITPKEKLVNPYSSVNMGVTEEGGLKDLSFKSIGYTKYAENVELIRDVLFDERPAQPSIIQDNAFDAKKVVESLKKDLATMNQDIVNHQSISKEAEKLSSINDRLSELIKSKAPISELGNSVFEEYRKERRGLEVSINRPAYTFNSFQPGPVDQISDVGNLDETPYIRADSLLDTSIGSGLNSFIDTGSMTTSGTVPTFEDYTTQDIEMN